MSQFINQEAEQQIIAGMLKNPAKIIPAIKAEMITIEHFEDHRAKTLFAVVMDLHETGRELHIKNLARQPEITAIKDEKLVHDISEIKTKFIGFEAWKSYIPLLKKTRATRKAYESSNEAIGMIEQGENPSAVASHLSGAAQTISAIMESSTSWKGSEQVSREFADMMNEIHTNKGSLGFSSGIPEIDNQTGGLAPEDLWVIAAPSSCGKTMLMVQILNHFHANGKNCLVFSFETNAAKIITRIISNRANINSKSILGKGDPLNKADMHNIRREMASIKESETMTICDNFDLTLESMMGIASQIKELGKPIDLILVDYIQLVTLADSKGLNREQEVSRVSRNLKKMAKEHSCPVISASQLNDNGAVRESRAIVQDADVLLKIDPDKGCIHLTKNRDGERGEEMPLYMLGRFQRFIHNPNLIQ
jgi:replicative DNA helicase